MRFCSLIVAVACLAASGCILVPEPATRENTALAAHEATGSGSAAQTPSTAGGTGGAGSGTGSASPPAQTSEERRAALEQRLDESVGNFDAQIAEEQKRVAKERDARAAANPGRTSADVQSGPRALRDKGEGARPSGDLHSVKQDTGVNAGGGSGNGKSAREIPDGNDDDIIARRLRKAAQQETDPELREKLWQEYLTYKTEGQTK